MDEHSLLVIMAVFVGIAAIAMVVQAATLFGLFKAAKSIESTAKTLQGHMERVLPKVESVIPKIESVIPRVNELVSNSAAAIDDSRKQIIEISGKAGDILDITRRQLARVDEILEDATGRARVQMDRAEMVLDDTMNRAQETVAFVHGGIMKPLREINGVASGLRTAFQFLVKGRPDPARATADEEMFI